MKNVIKKIGKGLHKFGDINLSIILFVLYIVVFLPYKVFSFFLKIEEKKGWQKVDKYNVDNKILPY